MGLESLFPGFDYIGASAYDGIRVQVPEGTSGVRISLGVPVPEILHLQQVQLFDRSGKRLSLNGAQIHLTSTYNDDPGRHGLGAIQAGKSFHSQREHHPALSIELGEPVVGYVEIQNRPDEFGRRSASLAISARVANTWKTVYRHDDPDRAVALLAKLVPYLAPLEWLHLANRADGKLRSRAMTAICAHVRAYPRSASALDWLLPLLDIYGGGSELDREMLSYYFAGVLMRGGRINQLAPARRILSTPSALVESEAVINKTLEAAGVEAGYLYTRHGLQRSKLLAYAETYVELAASIMDTLAANGFESFICYGTLLGALRERAFIAHDDDMDLVYVGRCNDPADLSERERVIRCLIDAGYSVTEQLPLLNVHVGKGRPDITVDLFPSWRAEGQILMYMEKMVVRPVDEAMLLPTSAIDFYGRSFRSPADPPAFLRERYGENWQKSDRFFEWPYPLTAEQ